jgi:hypothetical protein
MLDRLASWRRATAWLLAAISLAPLCAFAQRGSSFHLGIEVAMEFDRTEVVVGEPIFLKITVTNRSAPLIIGNFAASLHFPEGSDVEVKIQPPGELAYRYMAHEEPAVYSGIEIGNKLGEFTHFELPILYERNSPNGYVFARPGEYIVSARLSHTIMRDNTRTFTEIPPTRIVVREPTGRTAEAFRLIEGKDYALALQQQFTDNPKILNAFTTVAEKFADTPYAPMCAYVAGSAKTLTQKGQQEGIKMLREFARRWPNHPFYGNAIYNIFYTYHMSGNLERAQEWFYYLLDTDPHHRLMREENKLAAYYYYGRLEEAAARRWWLYEKPWALPRQTPNPQ